MTHVRDNRLRLAVLLLLATSGLTLAQTSGAPSPSLSPSAPSSSPPAPSSSPPSPSPSPTVVHSVPGSKYKYIGCWNETTSVEGAGGVRALSDGTDEVKAGAMTVDTCLAFCAQGSGYTYAGLEFSRECWCAAHISGASAQLDESRCNTPCDGNQTTICGGSLALSIYQVSAAERIWQISATASIALVATTIFHLL